MTYSSIQSLLGDKASFLLEHQSKTIDRHRLHVPSPTFVDDVWLGSDRCPRVLRSLQTLFDQGRLRHTGYLSILPVDQGIEHSGGASFAKNPDYFEPENIVRLAIEGGCNAVASSYGVLGAVARKYAHKIPFLVKFNHNELLTFPNKYEQITWGTIKQCWDMGAMAVGATIYFGSADASRQIQEIDAAASKGKGLVNSATEKVSDVAAKARSAAVAAQSKVEKLAKEGEQRVQETVLKAGHSAQELATRLSHSAQEAAQKIAHGATEVANAAEHRRQEATGKKGG